MKPKTLIKKVRLLKEAFKHEKAEIKSAFLCEENFCFCSIYLTTEYFSFRDLLTVEKILGHNSFMIQADSIDNFRVCLRID